MTRRFLAALVLGLLCSPALATATPPASSGDLALGDSKIHYETSGQGPTVVLLHGELLHSAVWDEQVAALAREHRVVRYDRRGFGRSQQPTAAYSDEEDLHALLDHLGTERAVLVGAASGAGLALDYALDHPQRVIALVLVGPELDGLGHSAHFVTRFRDNTATELDATIGRWSQDPYLVATANTAARRRLQELLRAFPGDLDTDKYNFSRLHEYEHGPKRPTRSRLAEVRVPALIVTGAADIPDVHAHAGALEACIAGADRVVIPGAGHLVPMEQPEAFNRAVLQFLSRLSLRFDALDGFERGFAPVDNAQLYYEALGSGEPLVLIHGGLLDHRMWDDQFEVLARRFRVVRYDAQGHGLSRNTVPTYWHYKDLARLLDHLGMERAHLMGLSLGGRIAVDLAIAEPQRVRSLVLVSTGLSGWKFDGEDLVENRQGLSAAWRAGDFAEAVEYFQRSWTDGHRAAEEVDPGVRLRIREMALGNVQPGRLAGQSSELDPPSVGRLAEITAPTLVVLGELDMTDIHRISDQLAQQVEGAKKVDVPGVAHVLNMERPKQFSRIVLNFLLNL